MKPETASVFTIFSIILLMLGTAGASGASSIDNIEPPKNAITVVANTEADMMLGLSILAPTGIEMYFRYPDQNIPTDTVVIVGGPKVNPLTAELIGNGSELLDRWFYPKIWWDVHYGLFEIRKVVRDNKTYIVVWGTGMDGTAAGLSVLSGAWKLNATLPDHIVGWWYNIFDGADDAISLFKPENVGFGAGDYIVTNIAKNITVVSYEELYDTLITSGLRSDIILNARNYTVPDYETLLQFLATDTTDQIEYVHNEWICVNYAIQLTHRAKLYGINSVGLVLGKKDGSGHAWNIVFFMNGTKLDYAFIEPQEDRLFKNDDSYVPEFMLILDG